MDAVKISAIFSIAAFMALVIKGNKDGIGSLIGVIVLVVSGVFFVSSVKPILGYTLALENTATDAIEIIIKTLGIAYLSEFAAAVCRDVGENGIATGAEAVGKAEILVLGFPLFKQLVEICTKLTG